LQTQLGIEGENEELGQALEFLVPLAPRVEQSHQFPSPVIHMPFGCGILVIVAQQVQNTVNQEKIEEFVPWPPEFQSLTAGGLRR
jgi:hypothetical protein